jgi:hypothetical protein
MNTQKGFGSILIILLGLLVIVGGIYFYYSNLNNNSLQENIAQEEIKENVFTEQEMITPNENQEKRTIDIVQNVPVDNIEPKKKEFNPFQIEDGFHHVRFYDMYEKDGKVFLTVDVVQRIRTETSDQIVNESTALRELEISQDTRIELDHCTLGYRIFTPSELLLYYNEVKQKSMQTYIAPDECDYIAFLFPGLYSRIMTINTKNNIIYSLNPAYYPG